jgi:hypothetical protein
MWSGSAWDWVIVVALYGLGLALFLSLGGFASAAQAIQRWGRTSSARRAEKLRLAEKLGLPRRVDG